MTDCLDSWTVLRWLEGGEPASREVERALRAGAVMSWINLGEVYDVVQRGAGVEKAQSVTTQLRRSLRLDLPTEDRVITATQIKARHTIAFADAFAIATGIAHDARPLTGDPEIIDASEPRLRVQDLRPRLTR